MIHYNTIQYNTIRVQYNIVEVAVKHETIFTLENEYEIFYNSFFCCSTLTFNFICFRMFSLLFFFCSSFSCSFTYVCCKSQKVSLKCMNLTLIFLVSLRSLKFFQLFLQLLKKLEIEKRKCFGFNNKFYQNVFFYGHHIEFCVRFQIKI